MADLASVVVCCQPGETLPRNLGVAGNGWLDSCVFFVSELGQAL